MRYFFQVLLVVRNPLSVLFYSRYPAELEEAEQWVVAFLSQLCLPDIATPQETIECHGGARAVFINS